MMTIFHAAILSVVEGVTEFLPISSTGHLILASTLLHIPETEFVKSFEIFIQLGAILAVVVLYAKTLLVNKKILFHVFTAFLPTAVIGFILYKAIKQYLLGNAWVVVVMLFLGGIVLIITELFHHKEKEHTVDTLENLSFRQSLLIGCIQSLSVIPGVSRAAATIIGAQRAGLSRKAAVEFSFLLAVPTMTAATALDLVKSNAWTFSSHEWGLLSVGIVGSFITALIVVKLFLRFIQNNTFIPFGLYRMGIAVLYAAVMLH